MQIRLQIWEWKEQVCENSLDDRGYYSREDSSRSLKESEPPLRQHQNSSKAHKWLQVWLTFNLATFTFQKLQVNPTALWIAR
jgi:hypothetical protein